MRALVTGVAGQLGHDVVNELLRRGEEVIGSDLAATYSGVQDGTAVTTCRYVPLDITDRAAVERVMREVKPDVLIHCAAWTAVDAAEDADKRELVQKINGLGTEYLAAACREIDAKMMYISTDYVFSGQGTAPWEPDSRDFDPQNVYGMTKLYGEEAVRQQLSKYFIVRIAWVFGVNGNNFIKTMLRVGATHPELRVVDDQIGTPTYTLDLAVLLADMVETEKYGTYHATNEGGYISWYEFAKAIFEEAGMDTKVTPVTTAEYGQSKAMRPFNSRLEKKKLREQGFTPLPDWRDALHRYVKLLREEA
ncbi:dTDP-4-dehydrorhamnose reductase [Stomatobaculum longum]|uniref:dTDP-4-dehydrorhamnose reductase n=1 Tax=Stomatobaculum longum TaxID=796942 RepID=UPI001CB4A814|nr:dTDP-4-dehydrorhamnose reductase [Stomatobaculum longum]MBF1256019.1 dTDP-4-dehydrorhamnose reductase [Stomatobaculum longum]